ncbi:hypothetical protein BC936DRAFT_136949 [Jimgerdemannia flammicorona]|uniref:Glycosyltransferase family 28 N-terminal domain-containing protein n=1 Tax=Jimgerdemannia flammicorona TaxID=994334 RepID=A0A433DJ99_9FUNG|nr:hypothetical protein BC936DRAFT_136949 [Jimgerdemannia flammicorona]
MPPITILFVLIGSLGDTLPFLALAEGLRVRHPDKYNIVFAAHEEHRPIVTEHGFGEGFSPIEPSIVSAVKDTPEGKALPTAGMLNGLTAAKAFFGKLFVQWHKGIISACLEHHPDLALLATFPAYCGLTALQDVLPRKIPYIVMHTVPAYPTSEFLPATVNLGYTLPLGFLNKFLWTVGETVSRSQVFEPLVDSIRAIEHLPKMTPAQRIAVAASVSSTPTLYIFSQYLVPQPQDWPAAHRVIGSLVPEQDRRTLISHNDLSRPSTAITYEPPEELAEFLESVNEQSLPLVYMGLGSMLGTVVDGAQARTVIEAFIRATRLLSFACAAIINVKGYPLDNPEAGDLPVLKDGERQTILLWDGHVPHSYLFPLCDFIVHHGGAGTTQAAVLYSARRVPRGLETVMEGAAALVVPCATTSDQPFWGSVVQRLAMGPPAINVDKIDGRGIARAIEEGVRGKEGEVWRKNVGKVAVEMWGEDGVGAGCGVVEEMVERLQLGVEA